MPAELEGGPRAAPFSLCAAGARSRLTRVASEVAQGAIVTRRYKAFISYSWADKAWGEWLHRTLETYRAPKGVADGRSLHPIFRDRDEEAAGRGIGAVIEEALDSSEFLIVLCSPNSAKSQWVNREIAYFKRRRDRDKILALIVGGEPGHATDDCFPRALTHKAGADLQPTDEPEDPPLAADARKEGDGKRRAKLKIAAAMLGVGLDDLVRRDERRRTARRRWAMSGMAAGMAALGGLSLYAFTQRDAAVVARNDALKARDDAEGLIELILTDLKSDLEGFGTLKSVTAIGNRAIGYYEGQDVKALTPDQLGRRARVLLMLGEADNKRGDLTAALARYETAAATTSEQLVRDPDNAQRIFDHAQSVFWVGYIAWQRGDHVKAKEQFTDYHRHATRLVEIDPQNDDWQAELEYAYSNLGTLAMDEGQAEEAEGWFRKSLAVSLNRLSRDEKDVDRVWAAGQSYAWLADSLHRQIELGLALEIRMQEVSLYEPFLDAQSKDMSLIRPSTVANYAIAQLAIARGNPSEAAVRAKEAMKIADTALFRDKDRTEFLESAVLARGIYSEANLHLNNYIEARKVLQEAVVIADRLASMEAGDPTRAGYVSAVPSLVLARIEAIVGNRFRATEIIDEAIDMLTARIGESADPVLLRTLGLAHAIRARMSVNGKADWLKVIELLDDNERQLTPEALALLAEARFHNHETEAAAQTTKSLFKSGYLHPDFIAFVQSESRLALATGQAE